MGKRDVEGVFVVGPDNKVSFRTVKVGIAGERHFEVLEGLKAGETIVAGTYQAIRELKDGALIKTAKPEDKKTPATGEEIVSQTLDEIGLSTTGERLAVTGDARRRPRQGLGDRHPAASSGSTTWVAKSSARSAASISRSGATSTWPSWVRQARASRR